MIFGLITLLYLLGINGLALWAFVHDKRASITGARRISEDRLLAIAFLGGSAGAKIGQHFLRHKIRKEPFKQQLNGIVAVQVLAIAALWAMRLVQGGLPALMGAS